MSLKSIIDFPMDFTVIDIETTGFSYKFDKIIELAAIKYRNLEPVDEYSTLINPGIPITPHIQSLTGITDSDVEGCPYIEDVINDYISFVGNDIIVGHNVSFDVHFINANSNQQLPELYVDTMRLSKKVNPELEHHRLHDLIELFGISTIKHRALSDCVSTATVLQCMRDKVLVSMSLEEFKNLYKKTSNHKSGRVKIGDITTENTDFDETNFFYGKSVVFTGKLEKYTRKEALQIIADLGGIPTDSVSAKTNILVVGDMDYSASLNGGISSKHKKATTLREKGNDIIVISESDFLTLLN